jgi:trigger factor
MQLDFKKEGNLEGVLTLSIMGNDYQEELTKSLKKYQKTMRFPGFRVGKTPMGLVKKQLGNDLKREEVNKLIQSEISKYYTEHKEEIIFMPLMNDLEDDFDWNSTDDYTFTFKVALRPSIDVDMKVLEKIEARSLKLGDEELEAEVENLRKQYGDVDKLDEIEDNEELVTVFRAVELDDNDEELEGGVSKMVRLEWNEASDAFKKELLGKKSDEEFNLDLKRKLKVDELCSILEIDKNAAKDLSSNFKITMQGSIILKPAELNEAFYEKVFYDNTITDEEGFRNRVKENLVGFFDDKDQRNIQEQVKETLLNEVKVELSGEFLDEWFKRNANLKEEDDFQEQLDNFKKETNWDLILEKLGEDFELNVEEEEIKNSIRSYVLQQYAYQMQNLDKEQVEQMTNNLYSNDNFRIELRQNILSNKVVKELKNKGTFTTIELTKKQFEEFVKENEL